jgi:hypothetical protein
MMAGYSKDRLVLPEVVAVAILGNTYSFKPHSSEPTLESPFTIVDIAANQAYIRA